MASRTFAPPACPFGLSPACEHLQVLMLIQKVLNIYDENFQEESMQWILFNFQVFQGWPRRFLRWAPEMPLRWEDINAEVSGYLIISKRFSSSFAARISLFFSSSCLHLDRA